MYQLYNIVFEHYSADSLRSVCPVFSFRQMLYKLQEYVAFCSFPYKHSWDSWRPYTALYSQRYWLTCFGPDINLSDINSSVSIWCRPTLCSSNSFWEGCPQGLRLCWWEMLTIVLEAHLCGHTLMLDETVWHSVWALIHPKDVLTRWGQDSVETSQAHPHQTVIYVLFVQWWMVMLEDEEASSSY